MSQPWHVTPISPDGIFLRSGPGPEHERLESAFIGDALLVIEPGAGTGLQKLGKEGEWLQVRSRTGTEGYVAAWLVQIATPRTPPPPKPLKVRTTLEEGLRVRSGPGTEHAQINLIKPEHECEVQGNPFEARKALGQPGKWLEIKTPSGMLGWAAAEYLTEVGAEKPINEHDQGRPVTYFRWDQGHALAGLHGPADPGSWPWNDNAFRMIRVANIKAVKVLTGGDIDRRVIDEIRRAGSEFVMARLFAKFPTPRTPRDFVDEVSDSAMRLYDAGIRYFEVHNEPNLHHKDGPEGMWVVWQNGREFGEFLLEALALLRSRFPKDAQFGWPGISPGPDLSFPDGTRLRYEGERFLREADFALRQMDFVCLHAYWTHDFRTALEEVRQYCLRHPSKLIFVTEFSNPTDFTSKDDKGRQYVEFYRACEQLPSNLGAVFSYIMSSSGGFNNETWAESSIPEIVGKR